MIALSAAVLCGCSDPPTQVLIDGSSTVEPISAAVAEEFLHEHPGILPSVAASGTGGGFEKFARGETHINDASRPIKQKEIDALAAKGRNFVELPIAYDGIAIVAHGANASVDSLTIEQLARIWQAGSDVRMWSDIDADWPAETIKLYGPGPDSGTFDYFVETVIGERGGGIRSDFNASENDHVIVTGIAGDPNALGYVGYAHYLGMKAKLKLIAVDSGNGPIAPSRTTIIDGTYAPLSRPLFIYVRLDALDDPAVLSFVQFYLDRVPSLLDSVGYVALPEEAHAFARQRLAGRVTGSLYDGGKHTGPLLELIGSAPR